MIRLPLALAACTALATAVVAADAPKTSHIELKNAGGASIGHALLTDAPNGVLLRLELKGLTPGWHGLHFHEKGDCSKSDFTSAGAHVHAKASVVHGLLNPDAPIRATSPTCSWPPMARRQWKYSQAMSRWAAAAVARHWPTPTVRRS